MDIASPAGIEAIPDDRPDTVMKDFHAQNAFMRPIERIFTSHRLVAKDFEAILQDLAPEGLNQLYVISGKNPSQSESD